MKAEDFKKAPETNKPCDGCYFLQEGNLLCLDKYEELTDEIVELIGGCFDEIYVLKSPQPEPDQVVEANKMIEPERPRLTTAFVRTVLDAQAKGQISYGKMVELLNAGKLPDNWDEITKDQLPEVGKEIEQPRLTAEEFADKSPFSLYRIEFVKWLKSFARQEVEARDKEYRKTIEPLTELMKSGEKRGIDKANTEWREKIEKLVKEFETTQILLTNQEFSGSVRDMTIDTIVEKLQNLLKWKR